MMADTMPAATAKSNSHSQRRLRRVHVLCGELPYPAYQIIARYQNSGIATAGSSAPYHQKRAARVSWPKSRERKAVWLTKNAPPTSIPPPASQIPQVRRSAFSSTVAPSHRSTMALASETATVAQSSQKRPLTPLLRPRRPLSALVQHPRLARFIPLDQPAGAHDDGRSRARHLLVSRRLV